MYNLSSSKETSIPTEYDLVCDQASLGNLFIGSYSIISALSGVTISSLADVYGRSYTLNWVIAAQGVLCVGLWLVKNIYVLMVLYGLLGFFTKFTFQTGLIYAKCGFLTFSDLFPAIYLDIVRPFSGFSGFPRHFRVIFRYFPDHISNLFRAFFRPIVRTSRKSHTMLGDRNCRFQT